MRILIQGIDYAPHQIGIGKYTSEMAEWIALNNNEVRVVTSQPFYPAWRVTAGYSRWKYKREYINGVQVWRCPVYVPLKPTGMKRLFHLASFCLSSLPVMLIQILWEPDVVIAIEPPLFCAPIARIISYLSTAKTWLHIQDFEVDAAFKLGLLPNGKFRKIAEILERWLMRRFERVSSVSKRMVDNLKIKGLYKTNCVYFPNWVDTKEIYPLPSVTSMRKELDIKSDVTVALYSGNMGQKQNLEVLIDAANLLEFNENILFIICGDGSDGIRIDNIIQKRNLQNILRLPLQPKEKLNDLLNLADIHLLPQQPDVSDFFMPSKLAGMMSSARPVIATAFPNTQIAEAIEGRGLLVSPGDFHGIAESIRMLASNQQRRNQLGKAARQYAIENWDKEKVLSTFKNELFEITEADPKNNI